jgi:hypothetical protein
MKKLTAKEIYDSGFFTYHEYYHTTSLILNKELISGNEDPNVHQFKVLKELILKHQTLFYEEDKFKIEANRNSITWLNYFHLKKTNQTMLSSLLSGIILNKEVFDMFVDDKLLNQIKPLVQEAMKDEQESKIVHEVFLDSLYNVKATKFLLDCGVNVDYLNNHGLSALMIATHSAVTKVLLKYKADMSLRNKAPGEIHGMFLGLSRHNYYYLSDKNAYELHSILKHDSILQVFKNASKNESVTHSEYFIKEYEELKKHNTSFDLMAQMKKENVVVLDKLPEFQNLIEKNYDDLINFAAVHNKPIWLEKIIDMVGVEKIKNKNKYLLNNYLELALDKHNYQAAQIFIEKGIYDINKDFEKSILMKVHDDKFMQQLYAIASKEMNYEHVLNASSLALTQELINNKKDCHDYVFDMFCKTLEGYMNYSDHYYNVKARNLKISIVDCLAAIVKFEKNEALKEKRFNTLIEYATNTLPYQNEKEEQYIKSKVQKLIKNFPEKMPLILEKIQSKFPQLVVEIEQKNLNKLLEKVNDKESHNEEVNIVNKPKKNKI